MAVGEKHLHMIVDQTGAVILDIKRGLISTLNPTGAYIWQGLEREEPIETIVANLVRETGGEHAAVERDVREFAETLKRAGLTSH